MLTAAPVAMPNAPGAMPGAMPNQKPNLIEKVPPLRNIIINMEADILQRFKKIEPIHTNASADWRSDVRSVETCKF